MMFARSRALQATLQQNWKNVTKKYLAVVEGTPAKPEGTLRDSLVESKSLRMHRVERGGVLAITHYRVLRSGRDNSLVELTLETGRKNQIRVQMAGLGHPDSWRSQVRRDDRSRAAPRAPFARAQILPSSIGRADGIPQRPARHSNGPDRAQAGLRFRLAQAQYRNHGGDVAGTVPRELLRLDRSPVFNQQRGGMACIADIVRRRAVAELRAPLRRRCETRRPRRSRNLSRLASCGRPCTRHRMPRRRRRRLATSCRDLSRTG